VKAERFSYRPRSTIFVVDSTIEIVEAAVMRRQQTRPTPAEVEVLTVLWELGPSTVREVHARLGKEKSVGYTGVLKLLQNMFAKGLVIRREEERAHVYDVRESAKTKRQLLNDLTRRVFGGSASQLMLHLLEDEIATPEEVAEIRKMLASHNGKSK
jgi:predicted transcriptional regulator